MLGFSVIATLALSISQAAFSFSPNIAGGLQNSTSFSSTYPIVSSHIRDSLLLRNFVSDTNLEEFMQSLGLPEFCTPHPIGKNTKSRGRQGHRQFQVVCHGLQIEDAHISMSRFAKSALYSWQSLPTESSHFAEKRAAIRLGDISWQTAFPNYRLIDSKLKYKPRSKSRFFFDLIYRLIIAQGPNLISLDVDASDGQLVGLERQHFNLHYAYAKFENDDSENVTLTELDRISANKLHLDDADISVYGFDKSADRAESDIQLFPYQPSDNFFFDQVQSYISARKAVDKLNKLFNVEENEKIEIYTNLEDIVNNAYYTPSIGETPPKVSIGVGDGDLMQNLNRDHDVITHEISHHYIYKYLKNSTGSAAIFHEGTADYLSYLISGDPYLAETVSRDDQYLRTAKLDPERKFFEEKNYRPAHLLGQFWSALLWDLYEYDSNTQNLVVKSMEYWVPNMSVTHGILSLLHSDEDHFEAQYRCKILDFIKKRGFKETYEQLKVENCEAEIRPFTTGQNIEKKSRSHGSIISCGSIAGEPIAKGYAFILLMVPLLLKIRGRNED